MKREKGNEVIDVNKMKNIKIKKKWTNIKIKTEISNNKKNIKKTYDLMGRYKVF